MADFKGARMGGVAALWLMLSTSSVNGQGDVGPRSIQHEDADTPKVQMGVAQIPRPFSDLTAKFNPPIVPAGCDAGLSDDLAHKGVHRELFSSDLGGRSFLPLPPEAIQAKAKALFEGRKAFYEKIFSCKEENEELHELAKELKHAPKGTMQNYETLKKVMNLVVMNHYTEAAEHFSVGYFQDKAKDTLDIYRGLLEKKDAKSGFDYAGVMDKITQDIEKNHPALVQGAIRNDLVNVFDARTDMYALITLNTIITDRVNEEFMRIQQNRPHKIPFTPGPKEEASFTI